VSFADLALSRALDEVLRAAVVAFERERLALGVERLEPAPSRELPARVDLLFDDPFRDVLLLREPEDFEDELRALLVLLCAMSVS
jgi:hypothetical protein